MSADVAHGTAARALGLTFAAEGRGGEDAVDHDGEVFRSIVDVEEKGRYA